MAVINELERGFTLTRVLDAPREMVFQTWTDPEYLQWFFNPDQPVPHEPIVVDLRVGGAWRQKMVIDEDTEYFTGGVYREIAPVEKLVFTWGAVDGWPKIDHDHPDDNPVVTVTLNELGEKGEKTEMNVHLALPNHLSDERVREWFAIGICEGWSDTIDRLVIRFAGAAST
jgi:uncharacterized protein YndB with AHSA1/START domain